MTDEGDSYYYINNFGFINLRHNYRSTRVMQEVKAHEIIRKVLETERIRFFEL